VKIARIVARRPIEIALLLLLIVAGGILWWSIDTGRQAPPPLTLYGNVDIRQVDLGFRVPGRLADLSVDEGDRIAAGAVLARLDGGYLEDDLRMARSRRDAQAATVIKLERGSRPEEIIQAGALVAARQATLENAARTLARKQDLAAKGWVTHQAHEDSEAARKAAAADVRTAEEGLKLVRIGPRVEDIAAARAQLKAEEAAVANGERRVSDVLLRAPSAGIIQTRVREPGSIVAAGETIYVLTLTRPMWVRTYVGEADLRRLRSGQAVEVLTDGGRTYRGRVGFISPVAEFTPKAVETPELRTSLVYRVRVIVADPDDALRQGMPVTVQVPERQGQ
jgi:HlyD family secretion protein